jgi:regulatory protein
MRDVRCPDLESSLPFSLVDVDPIEQAALRYLSRRDRTEAQMRIYLRRLGLSSGKIRVLIKRFLKQGYLNDEAYAVRWATQRVLRLPMGRERLEAELEGQGFDREIVSRTLKLIYEARNECELARRLLSRKVRAKSPVSLLRRYGFSEETIEQVIGRSTETV